MSERTGANFLIEGEEGLHINRHGESAFFEEALTDTSLFDLGRHLLLNGKWLEASKLLLQLVAQHLGIGQGSLPCHHAGNGLIFVPTQLAAADTTAVSCVGNCTVNEATGRPLKSTVVMPTKPLPASVTGWLGAPLVGAMPATRSSTSRAPA